MLFIALMITSCSGTRHLPPGEKLYTGAKVKLNPKEKLKNKGKITAAAESVIRPDPNSSFLGMRPKLWLYQVAGNPKKETGFRAWLKRQGEAPVLMSAVKPSQTTEFIDAKLFNTGIFNSSTEYKLEEKKHTVKVIYISSVSNPYTIKDVTYNLGYTDFTMKINEAKENTLLKPGSDYDLDLLKGERERIDGVLKDNGYFFFSPDYLVFKADTSQTTKTVSLQLTIKEETPDKALIIYKINNVFINPDYSLNEGNGDTLRKERLVVDSVIFLGTETKVKPKVILESVYLKKNDTYSRKNHNITLNRLMNLGVYKFVRVKFNQSKSDSTRLNMIILLTPMPKRTVRAEGNLVSKSNDFVGPEASVSYRNRNALNGAELLNLNLAGSFETQLSGKYKNLYSYAVNPQVELYFPRFIVPFKIKKTSSLYVPKTKFSIGYNYLKRIGYFDMRTFQFIYGYKWKESIKKEHELDPININYTSVANKTPEFNALLESNPFIKKSYEEQFIAGVTYSYTYNEQVIEQKKNQFYFNGIAEAAGNTFSLINRISGKGSASEQSFFLVGGTPYSQFGRISLDFRDYVNFKHSKIAARLFTGVGKPYGNSSTLPYIKQFFSGGPNSIRAFPINSLGPGTYRQERTANSIFIQQGGDVKLEGNIEYRFDIFRFLKGAVFTDAGNIWLLKTNPAVASPPFAFSRFYKEIAVGTGVGLRVDVSFFVLRFDLGIPLRKPWLPENERWVIDEIRFGSGSWRSDNLIFNVAIGYPF